MSRMPGSVAIASVVLDPTGTGTSLDAQRRLLLVAKSVSTSAVRFGYVPSALGGRSWCLALPGFPIPREIGERLPSTTRNRRPGALLGVVHRVSAGDGGLEVEVTKLKLKATKLKAT